ncbi:hypothetical protein SAMN02982917_3059 [Azospirillum oryzae]|uniref:Uncharacterized protein n=1 Tax=Azospirillum oryzae TaxID=286727 RepID=A0A1X7FMX3_9PROT|nr:hypothetical protein [Azospirillum sp. TSH100]SMF55260.1 hypothetical protein SAMN02982917_3059 [Azospirillum oryzae]
MTKLWGLTEEDRELARRANERVEALEKKIGRKLDPNDPVLLSILSSHPDTPFEPLLPPPKD